MGSGRARTELTCFSVEGEFFSPGPPRRKNYSGDKATG
jgi:hypothetical protein